MPYIKKELRPNFDKIYEHATYLETRPDLYTVKSVTNELLTAVNTIPEKKQTGCLNYFFTKILRFCLNDETWRLLIRITKQFFIDNPSYDSFERADGFLHRIQKECKRRGWPIGRQPIELLFDFVDVECDMYEDQKIAENGDS